MAPKELGGVVDSSLKVWGTANVRVVDASIMPHHVAAHTQSTVYAIGDKVRSSATVYLSLPSFDPSFSPLSLPPVFPAFLLLCHFGSPNVAMAMLPGRHEVFLESRDQAIGSPILPLATADEGPADAGSFGS
ncbi:hypothetical protein FS842_010390 [Serendipita sp. 407]|nr:hypothetical protein FRC20_001705 [Serendipita sp. 405]KAG9052173.1 hypothetical protein FS842_010390 [Serendipita sp. 407]